MKNIFTSLTKNALRGATLIAMLTLNTDVVHRVTSFLRRTRTSSLRTLISLLLVLFMGIENLWGADATISSASSNTSTAYYLAPDGTAISAIAGAGAKTVSYNSGSKITVDGKNNPNATITFTIASGVTITSFQVNGTKQNNTEYDLDGTSVTFGTALTGLSKTSSMTFRLHCKDASSSSSNRNTTITSIALTYTSATSASTWKLKGSFDNWGDGASFSGSGTTLTLTKSFSANQNIQFKIVEGSTYYGNDGIMGGNSSAWSFTTSGGNCSLLTTTAGDYNFSFNTSTKALTVTYPDSYKV